MTGFLHGRARGWPRLLSASGRKKCQYLLTLPVGHWLIMMWLIWLKRFKVLGFYSYGYNDNTCPPTTVTAALNVITAPKTIVVTPVSAHWRFEETNRKSIEWMKKRIN